MTGERNFRDLLEAKWEQGKFLCVGLDSELEKIPQAARVSGTRETLVNFNRAIIDATKDIAAAYKPNPAFYEAHGDEGCAALRETIQYIFDNAWDVPVILDAKRGDIGNTNEAYAKATFNHLRADALTVTPYLGGEPLQPFFDRANKGVIVLCHTSNPGADEIQALPVGGTPLYQVVAQKAAKDWNGQGNCCVMVGATYPEELQKVRAIVGDMPILIAGVGAQNGDLEKTVRAGKDGRGRGFILNASRSIIFASQGTDFAELARVRAQELHEAIQKAL
jgi:orotidine-5'-phosphate decarboxylase